MKLLASDVDNTLMFNFQDMKDDDLKEIKRFQKVGHLFGVCTGRNLAGVIHPSEKYDIHYDYYIVLSGAVIYNKDQQVIFEKQIPLHLVKDVFYDLNEQDMTLVYQDDMYRIGKLNGDDYPTEIIHSFKQIPGNHVSAFSFHFNANEIDKATQTTAYINEKYGQYIEAFQNNQHVDIAAKGCSKGQALKFIQDYFQVEDDDLYCIGDSWNDLPMMKVTQHSYTFTYAPQAVQDEAEGIVEHLSECIRDILK